MAFNDTPPPGITLAPSPWMNLPVSTYMVYFHTKPPLLDHAYAPLSASAWADPKQSGEFRGGIAMIMIVRYKDTPIGPYDELLIVPGLFDVPDSKDKNGRPLQLLRVTRIYVSQSQTTWNGRRNWNIPKHRAIFSFATDPDDASTMTVKVSPPSPGSKPFFHMRLSKVKYCPSFPFSTGIAKYCGLEIRLGQPPLPSGAENTALLAPGDVVEALCGTKEWRFAIPEAWGKASVCWAKQILPSKKPADAADAATEQDALLEGTTQGEEAGWPAYRAWPIGLWIDDGMINFKDVHVDGVSEE